MGVVGHMQADGGGGSDEKAVMTGDMGSSLWRSFEFMGGTPENANDTFLPGVSLLI